MSGMVDVTVDVAATAVATATATATAAAAAAAAAAADAAEAMLSIATPSETQCTSYYLARHLRQPNSHQQPAANQPRG